MKLSPVALCAMIASLFAPLRAEAVVAVAVAGEFVPVAVTRVGGPLVFANADTSFHNLVATATRSDGSAAYCSEFAPGACPLFWSPLVDTGGSAEVEGLGAVRSGASYVFTCEIHPGMIGTLHVL